MALRLGSCCSGYLGLDLAVEHLTGARLEWVAEISAAPAKVIEFRRPGTPNHEDLRAIDWDAVAPVDIVTAGWPCQPFSQTGRRGTQDDPRAIWPEIDRCLTALRPGVVVLENVAAITRPDAAGRVELGRVTSTLARLGFDVSWRLTFGWEVGAPHRRPRIFILAAHPDRAGLEGWAALPGPHQFDSGSHGLDPAGLSRREQIEVAGNGVNPYQAAFALATMAAAWPSTHRHQQRWQELELNWVAAPRERNK